MWGLKTTTLEAGFPSLELGLLRVSRTEVQGMVYHCGGGLKKAPYQRSPVLSDADDWVRGLIQK